MKRILLILLIVVSLFALSSCFPDPDANKVDSPKKADSTTFCITGEKGDTVQLVAPLWYGKSSADLPKLFYSFDGETWKDYNFVVGLNGGFLGDVIKLTDAGKVYIVGNSGSFSYGSSAFLKFRLTGSSIELSGELDDLIDYQVSRVSTRAVTTLSKNVFSSLFDSCSSITNASKLDLPSSGISEGCFKGMFSGCSNMEKAPVIEVYDLADNCFEGMFSGCSSLQEIEFDCPTTGSVDAVSAVSDLLSGVGQQLILSCSDDIKTELNNDKSFKDSFSNLTVMDSTSYSASYKSLSFTAKTAGSTISLNKHGDVPSVNISYKVNDTDWDTYTIGTGITLTSAGDTVYFRATNKNTSFSTALDKYYYFAITGQMYVKGNLLCLLDSEANVKTLPNYAFNHLFYNCKELTTVVSENETSVPTLTLKTLSTGCYASMFEGCTGLTVAPELKATTLADCCYDSMFRGCSALTTAPALPAVTLADYCYKNMFANCTTGLTEAPQLNASELKTGCYMGMFSGCKALTKSPALPASTLETSCYESMFENCSKLNTLSTFSASTLADSCCKAMFKGCSELTTAPALSASTLKKSCYESMFENCTKLETVSTFSASTLADSCCKAMFKGCSELTTVPALSASTLVTSCYESMFENCTLLKKLEVGFTDWNASDKSTTNWLNGVTTSGIILVPRDLSIGEKSESTIPTSWDKIENFLKFTAPSTNTSKVSIALKNYGSPTGISLEYITSNNEKFDYTIGTPIELKPGEHVYFKAKAANSSFSQSSSNYYYFEATGDGAEIKASGNIMYLLDPTGSSVTLLCPYVFCNLFLNCEKLTTAPSLSATTLTNYCYNSMFSGCTSLTEAPSLPAGTAKDYCYQKMFYGCTALKTAPALPATTLAQYCYNLMFSGCTVLTASPSLPAKTLAASCYEAMFSGCTSLTTAGTIDAQELAGSACKQMFLSCSLLKNAPILYATAPVTKAYYQMFKGCTSLTTCKIETVYSDDKASEKDCFNYMFQNCSSFNNLTVAFSGFNTFTSWMSGVSSTGTFTCPAGLLESQSFKNKIKKITNGAVDNKSTNVSAIPNGWKIATN